jgi:hypothetical protein
LRQFSLDDTSKYIIITPCPSSDHKRIKFHISWWLELVSFARWKAVVASWVYILEINLGLR